MKSEILRPLSFVFYLMSKISDDRRRISAKATKQLHEFYER